MKAFFAAPKLIKDYKFIGPSSKPKIENTGSTGNPIILPPLPTGPEGCPTGPSGPP